MKMNISANMSKSHTLEGQSTVAHIVEFGDCASEKTMKAAPTPKTLSPTV